MDTSTILGLIGFAVLALPALVLAYLGRKRTPPVTPAPPASGELVHTTEAEREARTVEEALARREKIEAELEEIAKTPDPNERRKKIAGLARHRLPDSTPAHPSQTRERPPR